MTRISDEAIERNRVASAKRYAENRTSYSERQRARRGLESIEALGKRPFVAWDGEGYNAYRVGIDHVVHIEHRYMVFGSSSGHRVRGIELSTSACLDTILRAEREAPESIHVGFAFDYDVNMILRDVSWRGLAVLRDAGKCRFGEYRIEHIPHKMFTVYRPGWGKATIYDVFGFFHCSYVKALDKYGVGSPEAIARIKAGKALRGHFSYADIEQVTAYMSDELSVMPELMECVREAAYGGGFYIRQWHGPGALATYAIKYNEIDKRMSKKRKVPDDVKLARRSAHAGGRFMLWRAGLLLSPVYTADINSAYVWACSLLPALDTGRWERVPANRIESARDIADFGLYHIEYDAKERWQEATYGGKPFPLFHRSGNGSLTWPYRVENWYWSPEASLVAGSRHARFLEAWIFRSDGTRPFEWVHDAYNRRLALQDPDHYNPAEKAYKWGLAAIPGKFGMKVGWDKTTRTEPRFHQIEWAGYIMSYCRAQSYQGACGVAKRGGLVSIDTDGVTSTVPFNESELPGGVSTGLGAWKLEEYTGGLFWQNGIYWLRNEAGEWDEAKSRGVPKGHIPFELAMEVREQSDDFRNVKESVIKLDRTRFVGYGQALRGQRDKWRQWITDPVRIQFGGLGKGTHVPDMCLRCLGRDEPLHTITHFPPKDVFSEPHKLPWLGTWPPEDSFNVTEYIWEDDTL